MNRRGRCDLQLASRCQESSVPHVEAPLALSGKPTHTVVLPLVLFAGRQIISRLNMDMIRVTVGL